MAKRLLYQILKIDVYCGKVPTMDEVLNIRDLVLRTQKKSGKPYGSHNIILVGDYTSEFMRLCCGVNLNIDTNKYEPCDLGIVLGNAPPEFYSNRSQVLRCPASRLKRC